MNWSESISRAIEYIENNLTNDITAQDIADYSYISSFYFQKGFSIICGYSISEYIRNRKLSLAGYELLHTNNKIIDIALKYGYDSPDSFTKAFTRFHGSTPTAVRNGGKIKEFAPLKINLILKGGYTMEYKIEEKESFKVIEIPKFTWAIFSCIGPTNEKMQEINERIFKEWLPNSNDYEIAAGYNIEVYSDPKDYKKGVNDEKYYSEVWIPIKRK